MKRRIFSSNPRSCSATRWRRRAMTIAIGSVPLLVAMGQPEVLDALFPAHVWEGFSDGGDPGLAGDPNTVPDGSSPALGGRRVDVDALAQDSDLVFHGVVTEIQYKLCEPTGPEQAQVPYTFITYAVQEVLQGSPAGEHVTLQFVGGWDARDNTFMSCSNVPQFDVGDEDVLFVRGNTHRLCPLTGGAGGRFRIIGGQVFTDTGREILLSEYDELCIGALREFDEVLTTNVMDGEMTLRKEFCTAESLPVAGADAVSSELFVERIMRSDRELLPAGAFVDADPQLPVSGPDMTPVPPPADDPGDLASDARNLGRTDPAAGLGRRP